MRCAELLVGCVIVCFGSIGFAESERMPLEVVQPAYRQTIYATQSEQVIAVRAMISESLRPQAAELRGRLLDAHDSELRVTEAGVKPTQEVQFDAKALPCGSYIIEVRAIDQSGKTVASGKTTVRKLPASPGSEVRIDGRGNIVVDGKPSVQIGWYGEVPLDDPRPDVIALQNLQTPQVVAYPDRTPVTKLFREHGIRTIVSLEPGRLLYSFELWKKPGSPVPTELTKLSAPSDECREFLRKMVELLRDEPGLFGWYIADEPEINNVRAEYLEAYYRTICELDPYHPVLVTNDTLDGIEKIGYRCCDILMPDPYGEKPNYVPSFLAAANRVMRSGQGLMLTPWHSAHHTHFTAEYGTAPPFSYRVMRGQYLATLAAGGRGFTGYTNAFFLPEPRLRIGLPHLWREVRFLEPFMVDSVSSLRPERNAALSPPTVEVEADSSAGILSWFGRCDQQVALIVMNPTASTQRVRVKHPSLTMAKISVVSEARDVAIKDGSFVDEIPAGEACVYSNDPGGTGLPAVSRVETGITDFEKNCVNSGNLLHASRGVKARASQGTTPWFGQIYYYAINGIVDDEGWHVTHAELPQWIELALPESQPIGRVVVHTPNLRDYDLQFRAADGSVQQAEVRGNTFDVVEHTLAAPVATLKLRLIARAVREGAMPARAMVREVEAYSDTGAANGTPLKLTSIDAPRESPVADASPAQSSPPFWREDFSAFRHKPKHHEGDPDAWVLDESVFATRYDSASKQLHCTTTSPVGYASMSRFVPYSHEHRYFQVSVPVIKGEGYPWLNIGLGDPAGKAKANAAVHTIKPGRYTVDTHSLHEVFRSAEMKQSLLHVYLSKGIEYGISAMSLCDQPADGLAITMADGSPVPRTLKAGDELLFRLFLNSPATDAVVEILRDSSYEPVRINGEPYVQLLRAGRDKDGRYWAAVVKLGPATDKFKVTGYPVLFRAAISGGTIKETMCTMMVDVE
jgi:hypothetical protein